MTLSWSSQPPACGYHRDDEAFFYALVGRLAKMDEFTQLEQLVAQSKDDWLKWKGGNKTAGTRVRKSMQDIKAQAQAIREKVLESRDEKPEA